MRKVAGNTGLPRESERRVPERTEEFPMEVMPEKEWTETVAKADLTAEVIDRHLDFESKLQGRELRPRTLCPEQKVSLVSDLAVV